MKLAFLFLLFCFAVTAQLQGNVLFSSTAHFENTSGGAFEEYCSSRQECLQITQYVPPNAQTRWGIAASGDEISGLGFQSNAETSVSLNNPFFLGILSHFNFPVYNAASSTVLVLSISVTSLDGDLIATQDFSFKFDIEETPNSYPCKYPSLDDDPCADKITFPAGGFNLNEIFTVGEVNYTLQLIGFRETNDSSSTPITYLISNEGGKRDGYLFAKITADCSTKCQSGAHRIIVGDTCPCDCSTLPPCPSPQYYSSDCSCVCPSKDCGNGSQSPDCSCDCPLCPSPQITDPDNCGCSCPNDMCGVGTVVQTSDGCVCDCPPDLRCPENFEVSSTCECECSLSQSECQNRNPLMNFDSDSCQCVCEEKECDQNYFFNQTTCQCDCHPLNCPNGEWLIDSCKCGNCNGNWELDENGLCLFCPLTPDNCTDTESFDSSTCQCLCTNLFCNVTAGQVIDETQDCGCRPCRAGECVCGNGIVEPGEDCDEDNNDCCSNCKYTVGSCDDGNLCTVGDRCNGQGKCLSGSPRCAGPSDCNWFTCDPQVGECEEHFHPNGTVCGQGDLCSERCINGVCQYQTIECEDSDPLDCWGVTCVDGTCQSQPLPVGTSCSDGEGCTVNDICQENGVCLGVNRECPPSTNECEESKCLSGTCTFVPVDGTCSDGNLCTINDTCRAGVCQPGESLSCDLLNSDCQVGQCDPLTGKCKAKLLEGIECDDRNECTFNDTCSQGMCKGVLPPESERSVQCGKVIPSESSGDDSSTILYVALGGAGVILGALAGLAVLFKKVKNSKIGDPDTWNPESFTAIGENPLYKPSGSVVNNAVYEDI